MERYTVAVTGAAGIVGTRLVQQLLRANYAVHAFVRTQPPVGHPLSQNHVTLTVMDFATAPEQLIVQSIVSHHPIAVIHCAAWVDVNGCEQQPELAYLINTQTTKNLARACARAHIHFAFISTEYVFDGALPPGQCYQESDSVHPLNHYGISKVQAELAIQEAYADTSTPWLIGRTAVLYGSTAQSRPDFPQWLRTQLSQRKSVYIASDLISSPTHAIDLADMLVAGITDRLNGIYHLTGSTAINRYQFALQVARHYRLDEELIHSIHAVELGATRPLNVGLHVEKISSALGRKPWSVAEGLAYGHETETDLRAA